MFVDIYYCSYLCYIPKSSDLFRDELYDVAYEPDWWRVLSKLWTHNIESVMFDGWARIVFKWCKKSLTTKGTYFRTCSDGDIEDKKDSTFADLS